LKKENQFENLYKSESMPLLTDESMFKTTDDAGKSIWKCKQCGKTDKMKGNLRKHMEKHLETELSLPCKFCGRIYKRQSSLDVHLYSKTSECKKRRMSLEL